MEGSAARSPDRLLVPGAPPPWDAGKLHTLSCPWGCASLSPREFRVLETSSRNPAGCVSGSGAGHAAEMLSGSWLPSSGCSPGWRLCAVPSLSPAVTYAGREEALLIHTSLWASDMICCGSG